MRALLFFLPNILDNLPIVFFVHLIIIVILIHPNESFGRFLLLRPLQPFLLFLLFLLLGLPLLPDHPLLQHLLVLFVLLREPAIVAPSSRRVHHFRWGGGGDGGRAAAADAFEIGRRDGAFNGDDAGGCGRLPGVGGVFTLRSAGGLNAFLQDFVGALYKEWVKNRINSNYKMRTLAFYAKAEERIGASCLLCAG